MRRTLSAALAVVLLPLAARAASATGTFTVTATVANVCKLTTNNVTLAVDFVTNPSAQTAPNTLTVNCTKGAAYNISLASANAWTLKGAGADTLSYVIYQPDASGNAAQTTAWDSTHAWTGTSAGSAAKNLVMTVKVNPGDVAAGTYDDTVTATVNF